MPAFSADSHIYVHLPGGLTRQYSFCNDPTESHRYLIGVLKDPDSRGGSKAMHEQVHEGDVIQISAPSNPFPLVHEARKSLLLAGGIGVTPILCMAERLSIAGADFEMHYCTRSMDRAAFRERVQRSSFASRVRFHFDNGALEQKLDIAAGTFYNYLPPCLPPMPASFPSVLSAGFGVGGPERRTRWLQRLQALQNSQRWIAVGG